MYGWKNSKKVSIFLYIIFFCSVFFWFFFSRFNFVIFYEFQKIYGEFELMGVHETKLATQQWQNINQRMQTEEAACVLTGAEAEENG